MRKIGLFCTLLLVASSVFCQKTVVVKNTSSLDRNGEMVEVKLTDRQSKPFILKNDKNEEVGYQLVENGEGFVFQADVKANSFRTYLFAVGKPAAVKGKTSVRFVPERKDDLSWENDLAAYRMYGPALAKENPSNGSDLWLKCTDELITDKFYRDELQNGQSYHVNHGQGLDCYAVDHTLGCGGIAPYFQDSLWVGNHFDGYKILEKGPLRSVFVLTYDSVKVGHYYYKQEITITCVAGGMLNKGVVKYTGPAQKMELAAGIFLHGGKGNLKLDAATGTVGYAEEAVSNAKVSEGRNYVGLFIPTKVNAARKQGVHALATGDYKLGTTFTYYFGGGWNKWGYPTDEDWFKALNQFAQKVKSPLQVTVK